MLFRLADLLEKRIEASGVLVHVRADSDTSSAHLAKEFARLETLNTGKPIKDAIECDMRESIDCFRYFAGWADKGHGEVPHFAYNEGKTRALQSAWLQLL
jgi:delta 1-pyrroline-5-carboxylate dehydrogenase